MSHMSPSHSLVAEADILRVHDFLANPEYDRNPWHVPKPLKCLNVVGLGMQLHSQDTSGKNCPPDDAGCESP